MKFAVIDTETNWDNEVMSIGVVIAEDGDFEALESKYIIIEKAAKRGGMFSNTLWVKGQDPEVTDREGAIAGLIEFLNENQTKDVFAYNAAFDNRCLPELGGYEWHDILKMAAYKQHNPAIPEYAKCCGTGRLKSGYKVENILCMFGEHDYREQHNALTDAVDELRIMKYLKHSIDKYPVL